MTGLFPFCYERGERGVTGLQLAEWIRERSAWEMDVIFVDEDTEKVYEVKPTLEYGDEIPHKGEGGEMISEGEVYIVL